MYAEAQAIAAGLAHSMVLKKNGSVWSTGRNDHGELGDGRSDGHTRFGFERVVFSGP